MREVPSGGTDETIFRGPMDRDVSGGFARGASGHSRPTESTDVVPATAADGATRAQPAAVNRATADNQPAAGGPAGKRRSIRDSGAKGTRADSAAGQSERQAGKQSGRQRNREPQRRQGAGFL